ncbi:MAG TPA: DUF2179 domain-containing protein [Flavobacteriaceae bacterium]|nr:DUF2179 domain-containing protein [Flavobacteriaceae bacterium]
MEEFFFNNFGLTPETVNYVILPLFIFFARLGDVTISTIRIIFVMSGNRIIAPVLSFFEAIIWLLAIGQIFNNIDNVWSYVAYAGGYATGTFIGIVIEEKLAYGRVVLRLFAPNNVDELIGYLEENDYRYSMLDAAGRKGKVNILFMVVRRDNLKKLLASIDEFHPKAFYTIEGVRQVSEEMHAKGETKRSRFRKLQINRK